MARPTWKGYLGFGLVQLPVELYPATQEDDVDFTMLDKRDLSPVGYKRYNKKTHKEVEWGDTVKGYEVSDGKYVVVTPADLRAAHPKATRAIDIVDFVDAKEISPIRWSGSYFVAPDPKASAKAYVVLREALRRSGKVGVAKLVLRTRQHLAAVTVEGDVLMLALIRFDDELRDASKLESLEAASEAKATKKEVELAEQLINAMAGPWNSAQYRDEYQDALKAFIEKKVKQGDVGSAPEVEEQDLSEQGEPADLMAALQASLKKGASHNENRPARLAETRPARAARRPTTARRAGAKKRPARAAKGKAKAA